MCPASFLTQKAATTTNYKTVNEEVLFVILFFFTDMWLLSNNSRQFLRQRQSRLYVCTSLFPNDLHAFLYFSYCKCFSWFISLWRERCVFVCDALIYNYLVLGVYLGVVGAQMNSESDTNEEGIPNSFNIFQTVSPARWESRDVVMGGWGVLQSLVLHRLLSAPPL